MSLASGCSSSHKSDAYQTSDTATSPSMNEDEKEASNSLELLENMLAQLKKMDAQLSSLNKRRRAFTKNLMAAEIKAEMAQQDVESSRKVIEKAKMTGKTIMEKINVGVFPVTMANGKSYDKASLLAAVKEVEGRQKVEEATLAAMEATSDIYKKAKATLQSEFDLLCAEIDEMNLKTTALASRIKVLKAQLDAESLTAIE